MAGLLEGSLPHNVPDTWSSGSCPQWLGPVGGGHLLQEKGPRTRPAGPPDSWGTPREPALRRQQSQRPPPGRGPALAKPPRGLVNLPMTAPTARGQELRTRQPWPAAATMRHRESWGRRKAQPRGTDDPFDWGLSKATSPPSHSPATALFRDRDWLRCWDRRHVPVPAYILFK